MFVERTDECAQSPIECNLFAYALNNPINFVDPTGFRFDIEGDLQEARAFHRSQQPVDNRSFYEKFDAFMVGLCDHLNPCVEMLELAKIYEEDGLTEQEAKAKAFVMIWVQMVDGDMVVGTVKARPGGHAPGKGPKPPLGKPSAAPEKAAPNKPTFDKAREEGFQKAGFNEDDSVTFTKVDPKTGTVVEFKGPDGQKVNYDSPHKNPGPGHDKPHVGWQTSGKRDDGMGRGNITYDGDQHPSRSNEKGEGLVDEEP